MNQKSVNGVRNVKEYYQDTYTPEIQGLLNIQK
jgi:hypothetical protein